MGVQTDAMADLACRQGGASTNAGIAIGSVRSLFVACFAACVSVSEKSLELPLDTWCLFLAAAPCAPPVLLLLLLPAMLLPAMLLGLAVPTLLPALLLSPALWADSKNIGFAGEGR